MQMQLPAVLSGGYLGTDEWQNQAILDPLTALRSSCSTSQSDACEGKITLSLYCCGAKKTSRPFLTNQL